MARPLEQLVEGWQRTPCSYDVRLTHAPVAGVAREVLPVRDIKDPPERDSVARRSGRDCDQGSVPLMPAARASVQIVSGCAHGFRIGPPGIALRIAGFDSPGTTISVLVVWQSMHRTKPVCGR